MKKTNAKKGSAVDQPCLSLRAPWSTLVVTPLVSDPTRPVKRIENRTWQPPAGFRGRLWIHASSGSVDLDSWTDHFDLDEDHGDGPVTLDDGTELPALRDLPRGALVGSVEVYDCVQVGMLPRALKNDPDAFGSWCWLLRDPVLFRQPVPCKGALRLWEVPDEVRPAVRAAHRKARKRGRARA
jgi:hypothetical protein